MHGQPSLISPATAVPPFALDQHDVMTRVHLQRMAAIRRPCRITASQQSTQRAHSRHLRPARSGHSNKQLLTASGSPKRKFRSPTSNNYLLAWPLVRCAEKGWFEPITAAWLGSVPAVVLCRDGTLMVTGSGRGCFQSSETRTGWTTRYALELVRRGV